jgi:hypothetical protein
MEMLETSAKSGENVLAAFEKLIGIVHSRALNASKSKSGIKGIDATTGANEGFKLQSGAASGTTPGTETTSSGCCG